MKRLKLFILVFCISISLPLAYVIRESFQGLAREERAQLRFFSQTLFDEMEKSLAEWVQQEENRAVDEYHYTLADGRNSILSPLARPPRKNYILGYLQNNPDGSFQTPLASDPERAPEDQREIIARLKAVNDIFNHKKFAEPAPPPESEPLVEAPERETEKKEKDGFSDRYLTRPPDSSSKSYLGRKTQRTEEISAGQAMNLSTKNQSALSSGEVRDKDAASAIEMHSDENRSSLAAQSESNEVLSRPLPSGTLSSSDGSPQLPNRFAVEVAPLQSVAIGDGQFFIFRRIAISNQIFRQGFVLLVQPFLSHLADTHFVNQPMAQFTGLSFQVMENGRKIDIIEAGVPVSAGGFMTRRTFPAPFDFLSAAVQADSLPASPARRTLTAALMMLGVVILLGLFAIYQSARTVVDLSERRSQFVSSVTHELKTPLTNIRMYIEMLEQGIAATRERELDYFHVLGSESNRLSRLINNVLELAKLEKKQRHFDLKPGNLQAELLEVQSVMAHKLTQEGFILKTDVPDDIRFAYDREVMIQVLINLIENSIKFGRTLTQRVISITATSRDGWVNIIVSDTGPGIPKKALKKVFDDFYRVDNPTTRSAGGTGIGLALVKKFIIAMGGKVRAANNPSSGCTIILSLPGIKTNGVQSDP